MEENKEMIEEVGAVTTEEQTGVQGEQSNEPERKYTDADVDRIIAKKIAAERKRMSRLFNEEQAENELLERERNVLRRELKADARDALIADNLPSSLANLLSYESKEDFENSYKEVSRLFKEAVEEGVKAVFKGQPTPKASYSYSGDAALKAAFAPKVR